MTYEELQDILKLRQRTPQGAAPTLNEILDAIQSQYQPQTMAVQPVTQGAQRFVSDVQSFGPIERMTEYSGQPVSATPMAAFTPGAFDINKTAYFVTPSEAQIAARAGQGGSDSQPVALSPQQEAFFNFLESPEGRSYKDARGAAMGNVIGSVMGAFNPVAAAYNYLTGQPGIGKSISALSKADKTAMEAAIAALVNYGVTSTAMGPPTAAQMAALTPTLSGDSSSSYGTTGRGSATGIGVGSTSGINAMDAMSDAATASSNGGYSTATGIGVGSTEGINAMDAMSDAASSSGSTSSSKIVCTAMNNAYGFGSFRNAIWLKYAQNNLTKAHEAGYHAIFLPLVDFAYKNGDGFAHKAVRSVLENIARHRSADLRAEMRGIKRDNLGRFYRAILEPICFAVGKIKGY